MMTIAIINGLTATQESILSFLFFVAVIIGVSILLGKRKK